MSPCSEKRLRSSFLEQKMKRQGGSRLCAQMHRATGGQFDHWSHKGLNNGAENSQRHALPPAEALEVRNPPQMPFDRRRLCQISNSAT
jgi:hypothetical protein